MKICIISPYCYPLFQKESAELAGGAEAQLKTMGLSLADHGHDVHFIVDDYGQPETETIQNVTIHKSPLRYMGGSNWYLVPDWLRLFSVLRSINADIHLIKVPRNVLLPLALYARTHNKKVIYIGQRDVDATKEGVKASDSFFAYWFYRVGLQLTDQIVCQTESQQRNFKDSFGKGSVVIPNVVTLPGNDECIKKGYVLWVGSSSLRKQPELFLDVAAALPDVKFRMIMALASDRKTDEFVRSRVVEIENLEYLGFVPFQEIEEHYCGADLFVSTSLSEGFPNTFLQSWQYGAPVVSLFVDPDGVILKHNIGRVSGTLESLIEDVRELMGQADLRASLASNAKRYIYENHSIEASRSRYMQVFNNLTSN